MQQYATYATLCDSDVLPCKYVAQNLQPFEKCFETFLFLA